MVISTWHSLRRPQAQLSSDRHLQIHRPVLQGPKQPQLPVPIGLDVRLNSAGGKVRGDERGNFGPEGQEELGTTDFGGDHVSLKAFTGGGARGLKMI